MANNLPLGLIFVFKTELGVHEWAIFDIVGNNAHLSSLLYKY